MVVDRRKISHSGTGRIASVHMLPMSLYESRESNGAISLKSLIEDHPDIDGIKSDLTVEHLFFAMCRGGWPNFWQFPSDKQALATCYDYINEVCDYDISRIDERHRNPLWARAILKALARNASTLAKDNTIFADASSQGESFSRTTFYSYLNILQRLFLVTDIPAWSPEIRSKTTIRSAPKREFADPSLAVAAMNLTPEILMGDLNTAGFLFENLCLRDIAVYSSPLGGILGYYHDRYGLEADAVLRLANGNYALIECKLGSTKVQEGIAHLNKIETLVRNKSEELEKKELALRLPSAKIVLYGGKTAYRAKDGVYVIPIGCLKD